MHIRWWQSIRWRLALGSVLLALLTTGLLALTAIFVIYYYSGVDQQLRLGSLIAGIATDKAQSIAKSDAQDPKHNLSNAINLSINAPTGSSDQQPLIMVFSSSGFPLYPPDNLNAAISKPATLLPSQRAAARKNVALVRATTLADTLELVNPDLKPRDIDKVRLAVNKAFARGHATTNDAFGRDALTGTVQPFSVRPIYDGKHFLGVLVVTPRPQGVPSFIFTVGEAVFASAFVIALLAALVAILFSQTLIRPLATLTHATRILASGDYSAQVQTDDPGELGELAHNFNHMATQLKLDVEELRQQEIWRRELIMNITHDLATPLTAIAGLGESLMDGVNQSREDYEATGRIIMHETLRLRRLVQDLHMMAKVEAGALQPKLKPVRLAALVDELLAVQAPEFERHQVEPINALDYNLPLVQADSDMLMRVFANLCNNALRHTPVGGTVTISAMQQQNALVISFTDSGEGIPEEALPRIFERFFRADSARQSSTGGSGLGLSIVRAIIEAHGGSVWAENAVDAGARIAFSLPLPAPIPSFV